MDVDKLKEYGFRSSSLMPEMYSHKDNFLVHVLIIDSVFYFRAYGGTIGVIETEDQLREYLREWLNK